MNNEDKPFDTIQGAWIEWLEMFVSGDAPIEGVEYCRNTFYGGASAMFAIINDMVRHKKSQKECRAKYAALSKEIQQFFSSKGIEL
jgi:hypothetical protein